MKLAHFHFAASDLDRKVLEERAPTTRSGQQAAIGMLVPSVVRTISGVRPSSGYPDSPPARFRQLETLAEGSRPMPR